MLILITPYGGHGTVFIGQRLRPIAARPDSVFGNRVDYDFRTPARHDAMVEYSRRTNGTRLKPGMPIGDNLYRLILKDDQHTLLSGACSSQYPFLSTYGIKATAVLRHPVESYVSFLFRQHPEHAEEHGGSVFLPEVAEWYCRKWVNIATDILESGSIVVRYKHLQEDGRNIFPKKILDGWDPGRSRGLTELPDNVLSVFKCGAIQLYRELTGGD